MQVNLREHKEFCSLTGLFNYWISLKSIKITRSIGYAFSYQNVQQFNRCFVKSFNLNETFLVTKLL